MTRTQIRQMAFELIYSLEIQKIAKEELAEQIKLFFQEQEITNEKAQNYILDIVEGIYSKETEILKLISQNLKEKWDLSRVSKVNLSLLKLAIYEIIYNKLPYKVVVNEVVELAKKYGDDNSANFINGILANIIKQSGITEEE